jgi:hypothetical protein
VHTHTRHNEEVLTEDLGGVTTAAYFHADVNVLELVVANKEHGLEDLVPHGLREEAINGVSVDVEDTLALFAVRDGDGILLQRRNKTQRTHNERAIAQYRHPTPSSPPCLPGTLS